MKDATKGVLALLTSAFLWGFIGVIIHWFDSRQIEMISFLFYTSVFSMLFVYLLGRKKIDLKPQWPELKYFLLLGLLALVGSFGFFYAFLYTKVANVELIHYTMPIWVFLLSVFWLREKINWQRITALVLCLAGLALIFDLRSLFEFNLINLGNLLALISAFSYTGSVIFGRKVKESSQYTTLFWSSVVYNIVMLPVFIFYFQWIGWSNLLFIIIYSFIVPALGLLSFYYGLRKIEASRASLISISEVVIAVVSAWLILGEKLSWLETLGAVLIIAGIIIAVKKVKDASHHH